MYMKKLYKKNNKKNDSLEDLTMLLQFYTLLNINFFMIYIIHKISVLLKITQISLKIQFSNAFSRSIIDLLFLKKLINFFSQHIMLKSPRLEKDKK